MTATPVTADGVVAALALPPETAVGTRVPKVHLDGALRDESAPAALRRAVADGVADLKWAASLKPATAGVPAHTGDGRTVNEVQVFTLVRRPGFPAAGKQADALASALHRAIKYPLLLVTAPHPDDPPAAPVLSLAELRDSRAERNAVVLDGPVLRCDLAGLPDGVAAGLLAALALTRQDRTSLLTVYRGWVAAAVAANAAARTGRFAPAAPSETPARAAALARLERIDAELAKLAREAKRETQIARRADLNARVRDLRRERDAVEAEL